VKGQNTPGLLGMQALDHLSVQGDGALAGIFLESLDDASRLSDFVRRRRENPVAAFDLAGVDQALAVEAEVGALRALRMHNIAHDSLTICGIDRLPFADIFGVPIACVAHDASLAGSSAVRLLLDRLEDPFKPRDKVVIAGQLENG